MGIILYMDFFTKLGEAFTLEIEVFVEFIPRLLIALIVAFTIYTAGKLIASAVVRILRRGNMPLVYHSYFTKLIKGIGAFVAVILFLNLIGYGTLAASLVAGGGLTAVMIGFAFKDIGENFLAGFFLAFSRSFRENDLIETGGITGTVRGIHIRHTHIRTADGCDVFVPSAQLFTKPLYNYTLDGLRRGNFTIGIGYSNDTQQVFQLLMNTIKETEGVLGSPSPNITIKAFLQDYIELQITFWVHTKYQKLSLSAVRTLVMNACVKKLKEEGIPLSSDGQSTVSLTPVEVRLEGNGG